MRLIAVAATIVALSLSAFELKGASTLRPGFFISYPLFLGLCLTLVYLDELKRHFLDPAGWRRAVAVGSDIVLLAATVLPTGYLVYFNEYVRDRMLWYDPLTPVETVFAISFTAALLEASRRTVSGVLSVLALIFIAYVFAGPYLPDPFWHRGQALDQLLEQFYLSAEGLFGTPLQVTADFVFLFVLLGALLVRTGGGDYFADLGRRVAGNVAGGPAKTAVFASTVMGMLQGSSAGNAVTTGAFTIPAMRRYGYPAPYAAGVEAVASTGGQLTPPIMGAAAFLMTELAGIPYSDIILMALIPAALYYFAVFLIVDFEARRFGFGRYDSEERPPWRGLLGRSYMFIPLLVMVWLLFDGYTPAKAGIWAIASLAVLLLAARIRQPMNWARLCIIALQEAPRMIAPIAIACAVAGSIAGIIILTGLSLRLSSIILNFAGESMLAALLMTMVACIVLGMGVPTSAAYVILAALLAPGLVKLGVPLAAAHLFIIYTAAKSAITPPVAVASFAAAAVAGCDPWRTSMIAFRLGLSVFIIPFMFVYVPPLLGHGDAVQVAWATLVACLGIASLSAATAGWLLVELRAYERVLALCAAMGLVHANLVTTVVGLGFLALVLTLIAFRAFPARSRERI